MNADRWQLQEPAGDDEHGELRFARAMIGLNVSFLQYNAAITRTGPPRVGQLSVTAAAADLDDALRELNSAWTAKLLNAAAAAVGRSTLN